MKSDRSWIRSVTIIERAFPMERTSAPQPSATAQPTATETARTRFIEDTAFNKPLAAPVNDPGLHAMALTAYRLGFRMSKVKNLLVLQVAGAVGYCFSRVRRRTAGHGRSRCRTTPAKRWWLVASARQPEEHVFTWSNGKPILDFRAAWAEGLQRRWCRGITLSRLAPFSNSQYHSQRSCCDGRDRNNWHLARAVFDAYDVTCDQNLLNNAAERI